MVSHTRAGTCGCNFRQRLVARRIDCAAPGRVAHCDSRLACRVPGHRVSGIYPSYLVAVALPTARTSPKYHSRRTGSDSKQPSKASSIRLTAGTVDSYVANSGGLGGYLRTVSQRLRVVVLRVLAAEILGRPAWIRS